MRKDENFVCTKWWLTSSQTTAVVLTTHDKKWKKKKKERTNERTTAKRKVNSKQVIEESGTAISSGRRSQELGARERQIYVCKHQCYIVVTIIMLLLSGQVLRHSSRRLRKSYIIFSSVQRFWSLMKQMSSKITHHNTGHRWTTNNTNCKRPTKWKIA